MNRNYKKGLTLIELLISVLLFSLIFLAVTELFLVSQRIFLSVRSKAILESELGYALDHMHKSIIQGVGDIDNFAVISPSSDLLQVRIDKNTPPTVSDYSDDTWISYSRSADGSLIYNDGSSDESLLPTLSNITIDFSLDLEGVNLVKITLSASYRDKTLTMYTAAYPRFMSYK